MTTCTAGSRPSLSRFGQIGNGYLAACAAAGGVISLALLAVLGPFALIGIVLAVPAVALCALVPALIFIPIAECRRMRAVAGYVAAGGAVGFLCGALPTLGAGGAMLLAAAITGVAGAVGGYVYHRVAGHAAGE